MPAPRIGCLDLDCFFVSVERRRDPRLIGKEVIVGAAPGGRGVVCACSYEVRTHGVRSGMPISEAVRRAPNAIYLPPQHGIYGPASAEVRALIAETVPSVQTASIDEFFLDLRGTEALYRQASDPDDTATITRVVHTLRDRIQDELGLPASVGLACSRPLAKMASARAKPAGVHVVAEGTEPAFVQALPVRRFPGIGPVTEQRLKEAGIYTLGHLLQAPGSSFRLLRARVQEALHGEAPRLGRDRPAFREHDPEGVDIGSISNERTFMTDLDDEDALQTALGTLVERVCWRARRRRIRGRTVTVKIRYADFQTLSRSVTGPASHDDAVILERVRDLFRRGRTRALPIRLLGVSLSQLVGPDKQLLLPLGDGQPAAGDAMDIIRQKFGYEAVRRGALPTSPSRWAS